MFIQQYAKRNPPLSKFDGDIARYSEVANNVQKEDSLRAVNCFMLDCSRLKFSIIDHCNVWQQRFTELLHNMGREKLQSLQDYIINTAQQLQRIPTSLDEMCQSVELLAKAQKDFPDIELQLQPLREQFEILEKYEVEISDDTLAALNALPGARDDFGHVLEQSSQMLDESKKKFRQELVQSTDELMRSSTNTRSQFLQNGPFGGQISPADALLMLANYAQQIAAIRDRETALKSGLRVFEIQQAPLKDLIDTEKDIAQLTQLWTIARDWDALYFNWKTCKFADIETQSMEQEAQSNLKQIVRIAREVKDKDWEMVTVYRQRIEQFKRLMPLIQDLKNPALRPRHWKQLVAEVGKPFDPESDSFNLGQMIELGLDQFGESVSNISAAASKELSIEESLQSITDTWEATKMEIVPYKDRGHYILRGTDEIYQTLEDNQVTLSSMKASRFVKAFEQQVDGWERTLSLILEVVEMILTVQRQWMYLESIFMGEDIRKQLPAETTSFDDINASWKSIMTKLFEDPNAKRGTHTQGLLARLTTMNTELEKIQKSLDMYLETKRQIFPRFYFVSNDDLLEILGQSKNPELVQVCVCICVCVCVDCFVVYVGRVYLCVCVCVYVDWFIVSCCVCVCFCVCMRVA